MVRSAHTRVLVVAWACLVLHASLAHAQVWVPVAFWQFNGAGAAFLADSVGTNTLVNGTPPNDATFSSDVMPGIPGTTGSALFDGDAVMFTANPLDLSNSPDGPPTGIRITWIQRNQSPEADLGRIVFEHSVNYTTVPGAFALAVNSNLPGTTSAATQGFLALRGITLNQISDLYDQSTGAVPGTWRQYQAEISLTSAGAGIIQITDLQTGLNVGTTNNVAPVLPPLTFANQVFYIGGRNTTGTLGFTGNIDELLIERSIGGGVGPAGPAGPGTVDFTPFDPVTFTPTIPAGTANGVLIDAKGVLRLPDQAELTHLRDRIAAARVNRNTLVDKPSKLRKVSLNRLEAAIAANLKKGQTVTQEMAFLAGLNRLKYVFYYPETNDIVLAGPAEGWAPDDSGRISGMITRRPPLQLPDLLVALRAFGPRQNKNPVILCSIDPTPEGLARMQDFLRSVGTRITPDDTEMIVDGLRTSLGMQNIRVGGISPNTRFAQVLLECDYRMKLIGIGLEKPPVRLINYVDRAQPGGNRRALERWYFIPDYNCARVAADGLGLELVGDGVKLICENQLVSADGSRAATGRSDRASESFTRSFTQKYPELAEHVPVFAEMRNLIDLSIAAAFIKQQDFYAKSGWEARLFNSERHLHVETAKTPLQVETVCTAVWKGNRLMTPVGGGVSIRAADALKSPNRLPDEDGAITKLRESTDIKDLPAGRWWWD